MSATFFTVVTAMAWTYPYGWSTSLAVMGGLLSYVIWIVFELSEVWVFDTVWQACYFLRCRYFLFENLQLMICTLNLGQVLVKCGWVTSPRIWSLVVQSRESLILFDRSTIFFTSDTSCLRCCNWLYACWILDKCWSNVYGLDLSSNVPVLWDV